MNSQRGLMAPCSLPICAQVQSSWLEPFVRCPDHSENNLPLVPKWLHTPLGFVLARHAQKLLDPKELKGLIFSFLPPSDSILTQKQHSPGFQWLFCFNLCFEVYFNSTFPPAVVASSSLQTPRFTTLASLVAFRHGESPFSPTPFPRRRMK